MTYNNRFKDSVTLEDKDFCFHLIMGEGRQGAADDEE